MSWIQFPFGISKNTAFVGSVRFDSWISTPVSALLQGFCDAGFVIHGTSKSVPFPAGYE